jgi:hypothetical protein
MNTPGQLGSTPQRQSMEGGPAGGGGSLADLSLVQIAQELERVTSHIEAERMREREARQAYRAVAEEVEANIEAIRQRARDLLAEQRRRMNSFDGLIGSAGAAQSSPGSPTNGRMGGHASSVSEVKPSAGGRKVNLTDAILLIWTKGGFSEPLTTEEISGALSEVGYSSRASDRSLKSTMNQALAKLCRERKLRRYRIDGTEIVASDKKSRARRYMPA